MEIRIPKRRTTCSKGRVLFENATEKNGVRLICIETELPYVCVCVCVYVVRGRNMRLRRPSPNPW